MVRKRTGYVMIDAVVSLIILSIGIYIFSFGITNIVLLLKERSYDNYVLSSVVKKEKEYLATISDASLLPEIEAYEIEKKDVYIVRKVVDEKFEMVNSDIRIESEYADRSFNILSFLGDSDKDEYFE
ncbi:hypothetical protein [Peptostreptococcus sp. D1]|uniref:hypothetical protein n=1 Tax=Peptostreptococcus sp. D1 TaxID=72304 RepID=UPI0008E9C993|nr:hypothetical protein [Peptostreptococcus sp. D1]SFE74368.1 hypothetical protein SAMN02910278_01585 [Peptostreptococcus sp. D1]